MSVQELTGDLFSTTQPAIGHGVNIYGAMGAGIAVLFKRKYPGLYKAYKQECKSRTLLAGGFFPYYVESENKWVMNLASQDKPGRHARLEWVESSLTAALDFMVENGITGLALPRIGAGIGGLKWEEVRETMIRVANNYPDLTLEIWSLPD